MSSTDEPELITTSQPPEKRHRGKRPLSVSPTKRQEQLSNLPGGCCIKCEQELGAESKAIQCDLCGSWKHSQCENVSDEVYENLNAVLGNLNNFVYYCDTNNCISRIKQLLFDFFNRNHQDKSHLDETKVISAVKETVPACFSDLHNELKTKICDITTQMKDIAAHNHQLQEQIKTITTSMNDLHKQSYAAAVQPLTSTNLEAVATHPTINPANPDALRNAVSSVINEEKDKQKRRLNLIVHNMTESNADQPQTRKEQDIANFQDILTSQLDVRAHISNAIRLGKKGGPKPRLLKVTVESDEEKAAILRNLKKLRAPSTPEQLKRMFITPDLTPREREANKVLRSELAQRNQSGNQYKIKNGRIVQRRE